jgi:hypothetical protein
MGAKESNPQGGLGRITVNGAMISAHQVSTVDDQNGPISGGVATKTRIKYPPVLEQHFTNTSSTLEKQRSSRPLHRKHQLGKSEVHIKVQPSNREMESRRGKSE